MVKGRLDRSSCKAKTLSLVHTDIERNKAVWNYLPNLKQVNQRWASYSVTSMLMTYTKDMAGKKADSFDTAGLW